MAAPFRKENDPLAEIAAASDAVPGVGHNGGPPLTDDYPRVAWRKKDWAKSVGLGISSVEVLIKIGEIEAVKVSTTLTLIKTPPGAWIAKRFADQQAGKPVLSISALGRRLKKKSQVISDQLPPGVVQFAAERQAAAAAPQPRKRGRPRGSVDTRPRRLRGAAAPIQ